MCFKDSLKCSFYPLKYMNRKTKDNIFFVESRFIIFVHPFITTQVIRLQEIIL